MLGLGYAVLYNNQVCGNDNGLSALIYAFFTKQYNGIRYSFLIGHLTKHQTGNQMVPLMQSNQGRRLSTKWRSIYWKLKEKTIKNSWKRNCLYRSDAVRSKKSESSSFRDCVTCKTWHFQSNPCPFFHHQKLSLWKRKQSFNLIWDDLIWDSATFANSCLIFHWLICRQTAIYCCCCLFQSFYNYYFGRIFAFFQHWIVIIVYCICLPFVAGRLYRCYTHVKRLKRTNIKCEHFWNMSQQSGNYLEFHDIEWLFYEVTMFIFYRS